MMNDTMSIKMNLMTSKKFWTNFIRYTQESHASIEITQ